MSRSMRNGARVRSVVMRLLAAATGALACVALVGWILKRNTSHDSTLLGVNAALSSILISWMVWKFTRKSEACVRAETALRESAEHLRLFAEGAPISRVVPAKPNSPLLRTNS
jgi:threonine/homoserine/homoserine lactone efflux protein